MSFKQENREIGSGHQNPRWYENNLRRRARRRGVSRGRPLVRGRATVETARRTHHQNPFSYLPQKIARPAPHRLSTHLVVPSYRGNPVPTVGRGAGHARHLQPLTGRPHFHERWRRPQPAWLIPRPFLHHPRPRDPRPRVTRLPRPRSGTCRPTSQTPASANPPG